MTSRVDVLRHVIKFLIFLITIIFTMITKFKILKFEFFNNNICYGNIITVKFELHLLSQYFHLTALIIFSLQLRHATRTQNTLFNLHLLFAQFSFSFSLIVDVAPRVVDVARLLILRKNKKYIYIIYYIL